MFQILTYYTLARYNNSLLKLIAQVKLVVSSEQSEALLETLKTANAVCNELSQWAWQNKVFGKYAIQTARYHQVRAESGLTAQAVIRCIAKVANAYKTAFALHKEHVKRVQCINKNRVAKNLPPKDLPVMEACRFKAHGSIAYDDRILNWYVAKQQVSIWTAQGRLKLPFVCGDFQKRLLASQQGESDLVYKSDKWFLLAVCEVEDPPLEEVDGFLGVDLGLVQLASDSEGNSYAGAECMALRRRVRTHRASLQKKDTKKAVRRLQKQSRRQSRYSAWLNHNISKNIVQSAVQSRKAIAMEDLEGIRERASAMRREMRWQIGNWSFAQLQGFVSYKAKLQGIPVVFVPAPYTSQTCSTCGHCERANRRSQSDFHCQQCGFQTNADYNASCNIARRGLEARASLN
jgi:putative transposase